MKFRFSRAMWRYAASTALSLSCWLPGAACAQPAPPPLEVRLSDGVIEGVRIRKDATDLRVFRGIAYAAPPVGEFRWREPQPVARWAGIREAREFAPRCIQAAHDGYTFRSKTMSEDCLYLNVWTPARKEGEKLPVLVYFHGGGFDAGDGSEPRYDGAALAAQGIVSVTVNYRLGVFGFFDLPELARESPHGTAGNYGLLDQVAALRWVRDNVARFGGDADQVTIGGESVGAISVSAHMTSPLSRGLFARAIGASGGAFASAGPLKRTDAQRAATEFAEDVALEAASQLDEHDADDGTEELAPASLKTLRAMAADELLKVASKETPGLRFWPSVDGHFLPTMPASSYSAGAQARVPLFVGTSTQEREFDAAIRGMDLTPNGWREALRILFGPQAGEALTYYPGNNEEEVARSAKQLERNMFLNHSTWRWMDAHRQTGGAPVYFYEYAHPRPLEASPANESQALSLFGNGHGAEIEYALGNLDNEPRYAWTADDREVSRIFFGYVAQFVKTGNPNGGGLPEWPIAREQPNGLTRQMIAKDTRTVLDRGAAEQAFMQRFYDRLKPPGDS